MMTVHEVSQLTGISIRTLQFYDQLGLLNPTERTGSGYRLYDDSALETLQQILLFRELEFPLKDIKSIIQRPDFDRDKALEQQIELLQVKKEHLDALIRLAKQIKKTGGKGNMDFTAFDTSKMDQYAAEAKKAWGSTEAYHEYEGKAKSRKPEDDAALAEQMMQVFAEIGQVKDEDPASAPVQVLIRKLRDFITEHYYTCTDPIFLGLGKMYAAGGEMTQNIDRYGGEGTGVFANQAIHAFCKTNY